QSGKHIKAAPEQAAEQRDLRGRRLDRGVGDQGVEVRSRQLLANARQFVIACLKKPVSFLQFGIKPTDALLGLEDRLLEHLSTRLILGQGAASWVRVSEILRDAARRLREQSCSRWRALHFRNRSQRPFKPAKRTERNPIAGKP